MIRELWAADDFEAGAQVLLAALHTQALQAIESDPGSRGMRILRLMLHLRPGGSYQGLVVHQAPGTRDARSDDSRWLLPSATVWRQVEHHRQAVAVALLMGTIQLVETGRTMRWSMQRSDPSGGHDASMQRLLDRDATHLYALPLRSPGGAIQGMISVEMSTRAMTSSFDWSRQAPALQLLADVATPALMLLPRTAQQPSGADPLLPVVGRAMADTVRLLGVFASMDETVLVSGPTGAGKSRLARWCHARSARAEGPFETVDLLTIPEQTQMAELFGWKRGAFTGAVGDQQGYVARAAGGTLFIDEIDKLSLKAQAGLLQLLETRSYRPLGSNSGPIPADLRFVVGTNADLPAAIREGRFREDLFYRINVLPVRLPALAERKDEIPGWAAFMLNRRHAELRQPGQARFSEAAVALLAEPDWPGNLRQLDNAIRRAYAMGLALQHPGGDLVIDERHVTQALGFEVGGAGTGRTAPPLLEAFEAAAERFVELAQAQQAAGGTMALEHAEALRGAILRRALGVTGDLKEVYQLFGRHAVVASRNHQRDYRRELERLERLEHRCSEG